MNRSSSRALKMLSHAQHQNGGTSNKQRQKENIPSANGQTPKPITTVSVCLIKSTLYTQLPIPTHPFLIYQTSKSAGKLINEEANSTRRRKRKDTTLGKKEQLAKEIFKELDAPEHSRTNGGTLSSPSANGQTPKPVTTVRVCLIWSTLYTQLLIPTHPF